MAVDPAFKSRMNNSFLYKNKKSNNLVIGSFLVKWHFWWQGYAMPQVYADKLTSDCERLGTQDSLRYCLNTLPGIGKSVQKLDIQNAPPTSNPKGPYTRNSF